MSREFWVPLLGSGDTHHTDARGLQGGAVWNSSEAAKLTVPDAAASGHARVGPWPLRPHRTLPRQAQAQAFPRLSAWSVSRLPATGATAVVLSPAKGGGTNRSAAAWPALVRAFSAGQAG